MGVHGLWRLIEPSGKPVPLETLENKVLAVDVSIWLHHFVKGFQDSKGAPVPNAHLLGIYHRLCKLLYFRIKPVFVFDGGVPALKKQTIALRNQQKSRTLSEAERIHKNLLSALVKHSAISKVLTEKAKAAIAQTTSPSKKSKVDNDDLYKLPESQSLESSVASESDSSDHDDSSACGLHDLHSIDTQSAEFKSLPVDVRHEILTDLKDTRKQSSWGRIHELPTKSDDFSGYQMRRLLKRQSVQIALEEAEKEMGGHSLSLGELEKLLNDQGVITNLKGNRIASDENARFFLIKDIKRAVEEATRLDLQTIAEESLESSNEADASKNKGEMEFEDDLKKAIALSLEDVPSTSSSEFKMPTIGGKGNNRIRLSFLDSFHDEDDSDSSADESIHAKLTPAQSYMMEYSGLTPSEIAKIIAGKTTTKSVNGEQGKVQAKTEARKIGTDVRSQTKTTEIETIAKIADIETVSSTANTNAEQVEAMSDESSTDDFLDVENETNTMEVVIRPDETVEDDLFKDVFEKNDVFQTSEADSAPLHILSKDIKSVQHIISEEDTAIQNESQTSHNSTDGSQVQISSSQDVVIKNSDGTITKSDLSCVEDAPSTHEPTRACRSPTIKDTIKKMIQEYSDATQPDSSSLSVERLNQIRDNLRQEHDDLVTERSAKERHAGNITDQMYQEAQELLELFGVPYVVAPMEAEAQCAFLELIDLTDGTITDDSDIWLFGGHTVYKNFFNQQKVVMEFKSESIQHNFKLTRDQMILLAMLVGSDYTPGLSGVGPVTALEILAAFPPKSQLLISGLAEFKSWFTKGRVAAPGRTSLRGKLKNLCFTDNFPNPQIVDAYLDPRVETSKEKFAWSKPDVVGLVEFARQKFGWTKIKTDEILKPVLKRMEEHHSQKSITDYFKYEAKTFSGDATNKMSKRVKSAIDKIGKAAAGEDDEPEEKKTRVDKKSKTKASGSVKRSRGKKADEDIEVLKQTRAVSKKRVEEIQNEVQNEIEKQLNERTDKKVDLRKLHRRETIPQKQKDKDLMMKNKLKAIETLRKSKQGPGFVKKRTKTKRTLKENAGYLSESSSD